MAEPGGRTARSRARGRDRYSHLRHYLDSCVEVAEARRRRYHPHQRLGPFVPGSDVMDARFDLVIRHADIATAADRFEADIGIIGGRIVALGTGLAAGAREIDAAGPLVTPRRCRGTCD